MEKNTKTKEMSQGNNTLNFLIHDANGQPQVVKVVQKSSNRTPQTSHNPVKVIRVPAAAEEGKAQVYRTVKLSALKGGPRNPPDMFTDILQLPESSSTEPIVKLEEGEEEIETENTVLEELQYYSVLPKSSSSAQTAQVRVTSSASAREIASMSHSSKRRNDSDNDPPVEYTTKRRRHADKVGKGLRHFSMKVCEKVRNKGFTSYNEVADELVLEFAAGMHGSGDSQQYDQKNIRRRVYDALNVLMAMNIISKEKKEIRWLGLPTNSVQECYALEKEKQEKIDQIQKKTQQLQELVLQHISFKSLIERNREAEDKGVKPSPSSAIHLPFIVVNTSDKALIDCSISNDKTEYMFNFNKRFQIHDDIDILKRMGLLFGIDKGECTEENIEKAKHMVPKSLENYVVQLAKGDIANISTLLEEDYDDDGEDEGEIETLEPEPEQVEDEPEEPENSDEDSSDVDV